MNTQFKKGVLELCVLAVVSNNDVYGYQLVQLVAENIDMAEGTVYPLLRRLTVEGYFSTYLRESQEGPPRKYYSITDSGLNQLKSLKGEWMNFVDGVNKLLNAHV